MKDREQTITPEKAVKIIKTRKKKRLCDNTKIELDAQLHAIEVCEPCQNFKLEKSADTHGLLVLLRCKKGLSPRDRCHDHAVDIFAKIPNCPEMSL